MSTFDSLANEHRVQTTVEALSANGITAHVVNTAEEAKQLALTLIPEKAEVMTMSSVSVEQTGLTAILNDETKYNSVYATLKKMDRATQHSEMQQLGAAPDYMTGSVQAVTEDGKLIVASNSGSQLPAISYASSHVILIVGTQKIVKDLDEGLHRLNEYVLPLESERAKKAYGVPGSFVSKLLIINRELVKGRITVILVHEKLGY